jgi:hypothetical protein
MRILLDCDGVLADFVGAVRKVAPSTPDPLLSYDFPIPWGEVAKEGFCASIEPLPGAKDFVDELFRQGHSIVCVTSPPWSSRTWAHERAVWLRENMGIRMGLVMHVPACLKHRVTGDVIIEDNERVIEQWQDSNPTGMTFLFNTTYTACGKREVWTYDEILKVLEDSK